MAIRQENVGEMAPERADPLLYASQHPQSEGVLIPDAWQFDTGVEEIRYKNEEEPDQWGNRLTRYRVTMSDGVRLGMNYMEPKERATDIAVIETPAWFTGLHGFNEATQREFGRMGFPSLLIGHVGSERDSAAREVGRFLFKPWETVREMRGISQAHQASNMLAIIAEKASEFTLDPENVLVHGNSRGAMVANAIAALAPTKGIDVTFAMPVAPCFAEGFGRETINELRSAPGNEAYNAGKIAVRNLFNIAGSNINTLNASPKSLAYEVAHIDSLFNGDAGRFVPYIPKDQNMLVLAYESDAAGQKKKWQEKYQDHPNVHVDGVPGAHLSIADKRTTMRVQHTFEPIAEQLHDGVEPEDLDFSHIKRHMHSVKDKN